MAKATVNISLPPTMREQIKEIVSTEGYGNTSEFFRELVREYLKKQQEKKFEAMVLEAIESNDYSPVTPQDFVDMRKELEEYIKSKQKNSLNYENS